MGCTEHYTEYSNRFEARVPKEKRRTPSLLELEHEIHPLLATTTFVRILNAERRTQHAQQ